jgi:hypothetical protein
MKEKNENEPKASIRGVRSNRKKRYTLYSLTALAAIGASVGVSYLAFQHQSQEKARQAANEQNESTENWDIPTGDDVETPVQESNFSKTINKVMAAKEIQIDDSSVTLNPGKDPAVLNLKNIDVNLDNFSTLDFDVSAQMEVTYGGLTVTIPQVRFEDDYALVTYRNKGYAFDGIQNLSDVVKMVQSLGITMPSSSDSDSGTSTKEILSQIEDKVSKVTATESTDAAGNYVFEINLGELTVQKTKITGLDFTLTANKDYELTGVSLGGDKVIVVSEVSDSAVTEKARISLSVSTKVLSTSTYQKADRSAYTDMTATNSSLFSTVTKLAGERKVKVGIDGTLSIGEEQQKLSGTFRGDVSNLGKDFEKGTYDLDLKQLSADSSTTYNQVAGRFTNGTTYFNLNDGFVKGKVLDSDVKNFFAYLDEMVETTSTDSEVTKTKRVNKVFQGLTDELNLVLTNTPLDDLKNHDLSSLNGFVKDFSYTTENGNEVLTLKVNGAAFGLGKGDGSTEDGLLTLVLTVKPKAEGETTGKLSSLSVQGLVYKSLTLSNLTLSLEDFDSIAALTETDTYKDYRGTIGIFRTLADYAADKKGSLAYSFLYSQAGNTDYVATGSIDADGSALQADGKGFSGDDGKTDATKVVSYYSVGTYHLGMNLKAANSTLSHQFDLTYLGDSASKSGSLYASYNEVLKNYVTSAQLGDMAKILSSRTGSDASTNSLSAMDQVLDALKASESFRNDLKALTEHYSIEGLKSFVRIDKTVDDSGKEVPNLDATKFIVEVNTDYVFAKESFLSGKIGALTLTVNMKDPTTEEDGSVTLGSLAEIDVSTMLFGSDKVSFSLKPQAYSFDPSAFSKDGYTQITDAAQILSAFYSLPDALKKGGVKVSASFENSQKYTLSGSARYDVSDSKNPSVSGALSFVHPDLNGTTGTATQKVEFTYQNDANLDGQFVGEYNDKLHVRLHQNSVKSMLDAVMDASSSSKTNVTNAYKALSGALASTQDLSSGLPLVQAVQKKDPSILLSNPYVQKVEFKATENTMVVTLDAKLLDANAASGAVDTLTVAYKPGTKDDGSEDPDSATLSSVTLSMDVNGTAMSASISLLPYGTDWDESVYGTKPEVMAYSADTKKNFVDLDGLKTLVSIGVDTSEYNYFHVSGNVYVDTSLNLGSSTASPETAYLNALSFSLGIDSKILVRDEEILADITVNDGNKTLSTDGYHATEFFLSKDNVYVAETKTKGTDVTSEVFKTSYATIKKNPALTLVSFSLSRMLDLDDRIAGRTAMAQIYKALDDASQKKDTTTEATDTTEEKSGSGLSVTLNNDFSEVLAEAFYGKSRDASTGDVALDGENDANNRFSASLNLNQLVSGLSDYATFHNTTLDLYHQTEKQASDGTRKKQLFYGLKLKTGLSLLGGIADVNLRADLRSNANNGDILYYSYDEGGTKAAKSAGMNRYFAFTEAFAAAHPSAKDYEVTGVTLKTRRVVDLKTGEIQDFANDYALVDNASEALFTVTTTVSGASSDANVVFFVGA